MEKIKLILHWLGLLPAVLLAAWLMFVFIRFCMSITFAVMGGDPDGFWVNASLNLMPYIIQGGAFVYLGGRFAPAYKQVVAYFCSVVVICHATIPLSLVLWQYGLDVLDWWGVVGAIAEVGGAVAVILMSYQDDHFFTRL